MDTHSTACPTYNTSQTAPTHSMCCLSWHICDDGISSVLIGLVLALLSGLLHAIEVPLLSELLHCVASTHTVHHTLTPLYTQKNSMYHMKIELKDRKMSQLIPTEDNEFNEVYSDSNEDLECVEFSVGNPRVEHITGLVHLYKKHAAEQPTSPPKDAAASSPSSSSTNPWTNPPHARKQVVSILLQPRSYAVTECQEPSLPSLSLIFVLLRHTCWPRLAHKINCLQARVTTG